MISRMEYLLTGLLFLSGPLLAATLSDIQVSNGKNHAMVMLSFSGKPVYAYFSLHHPDRIVLDIHQSSIIKSLPLTFSRANIVARIRTSTVKDKKNFRLVFELTHQPSITCAIIKHNGNQYSVVFKIRGAHPATKNITSVSIPSKSAVSGNRLSMNSGQTITRTITSHKLIPKMRNGTVIIAIDAGHGGQDPGAIGQHGLMEKNVTIAISRKFWVLLNKDPMFKGVLTRDGDYFISVIGRSDVARKANANVLISIHADAAPNHVATGASVWVLSNRRANTEMANWLEQKEKQSELLGGAGNLLATNQADPYLSQAVLDLQFGNSQRVGYEIATNVIQKLRSVTRLHKQLPKHASLGVLRSPDIPSLLVETGFISNASEERMLGSSTYQKMIAHALYNGLRDYFLAHPLQVAPLIMSSTPVVSVARNPVIGSKQYTTTTQNHTVTRGETLSSIAEKYGVSVATLRKINTLRRDVIWVGQRLKVPTHTVISRSESILGHITTRHKA